MGILIVLITYEHNHYILIINILQKVRIHDSILHSIYRLITVKLSNVDSLPKVRR